MKEAVDFIKNLNGRVLAGVSGGPDSMVLASLLMKFSQKPVIAHVNYRLREDDSEQDETLVCEFARQNNLEFFCKRVDEKPDGNFQEWARKIRYEWFDKIRKALKLDYIATAHHKDDQLETLIFRLMRSGHPADLAGITRQDGALVRPLLNITKKELLEFAHENNIGYRTDHTNLNSAYDRNLIRNEIIPELDKSFPDWRDLIQHLPSFSAHYHQVTGELLGRLASENMLDFSGWIELSADLQKTVLARWISDQTGSPVSRSWLRDSFKIAELQTGGMIRIDSQRAVFREREKLILVNPEMEFEQDVSAIITKKNVEEKLVVNGIRFHFGKWGGKPESDILQLDADKIKWPLRLRNWASGDKIQPPGMRGSQLISDFLTNRKIESHKKKQTLVIEAFDATLAAVIFPRGKNRLPGMVSRPALCDQNTIKTLEICVSE